MGLKFNDTDIYGVNFNGTSLTQINFNGTPVWYALQKVSISVSDLVPTGVVTATTTPSAVQSLCTYSWYRTSSSSASGGTLIATTTSNTYTLTTSDCGYYIYCIAEIGTASATSNVSSKIWTSNSTTKSKSSTYHYAVGFTVESTELASWRITKLVVYSSSRTRTGDSYVNASFKTPNGDSVKNPTSSGTLVDGTTYTGVGQSNGYTITFSKPVLMSEISVGAGSGVGQWRETDYIDLTMYGYYG